jgi:light-harvesting complex 1 beta chain
MVQGNFTVDARDAVKEPVASFRLIFIASFAVIFVVALAASLLAMDWRSWFPGAENGKSVVGGVKAAVYTFMSNLS